MPTTKDIEQYIIKELNLICKDTKNSFSANTQLVGANRAIKSVQLVELLLKIEGYVEKNFNSTFNWADNSAMSDTRSVLRTVKSLADHVFELNPNKWKKL